MLKYIDYDIVFSEVPDEVTLAINITQCPNNCIGCHSPHLREDIGNNLYISDLNRIISGYKPHITCICFMGGDKDPYYIQELASYIKQNYNIKTAWYSGKPTLPKDFNLALFNFIKLGEYIEANGGLRSYNSNQRFYKIIDNKMIDLSDQFR